MTSLSEEVLSRTSWIAGELHGEKDFELLNYLENLGFLVSLKKEIDNRLFMFSAGKNDLVSKLSKKDIKTIK